MQPNFTEFTIFLGCSKGGESESFFVMWGKRYYLPSLRKQTSEIWVCALFEGSPQFKKTHAHYEDFAGQCPLGLREHAMESSHPSWKHYVPRIWPNNQEEANKALVKPLANR